LRSRLYLDPGESSYFKASVDEVYVEGSADDDSGSDSTDDSSDDSSDDSGGGGGGCFITTMK
jgi:hypothetical protein